MSIAEIKEIFDKSFFKKLEQSIKKTLRKALPIVIMILVISNFYVVAIIPTESMHPTLQVKDLVLVRRTSTNFERGDIIAFEENGEKSLLKRVIGFPGDTIEISNGIVYVNNEPLVENYLNEKPEYDYPKVLVPKQSYFVLGDNRNNSNDSHFWGFLSSEKIKGKAEFILLPFKHFKNL